jgi:Fe2+ or Zn2+ uptake regulation protein
VTAPADRSSSPSASTERERQLRGAGLRVTRQRLAVLEVLEGGGHLDAGAVMRAVRRREVGLSWQGTYDVLTALTDAHLVRRVESAGSAALFELRTGRDHHHRICRTCHRVDDIACVGDPPCLPPSTDSAFLVDDIEITYWGRCSTCAGRGDATPTKEQRP